MRKVLIIGGGFAGLSAARVLHRHRRDFRVTLADSKTTSDFLPALPDVVGGRISARGTQVSIPRLSRHLSFRYVHDEICGLDIENRRAEGRSYKFDYEMVIVAAGTRTSFHGNDNARRHCMKLDTSADATALQEAFGYSRSGDVLVVGAGYTGIEIATNIKRRFMKNGMHNDVIIVEASSAILGRLPQWMQDYAVKNLTRMGIKCLTGRKVQAMDLHEVVLSDGTVFEDVAVVWAAGVRAPEIVGRLPGDVTPQGRVRVDPNLQVSDGAYVVGDAAAFYDGDMPLRMSVQSAITQGTYAARHLVARASGRKMRPYRPLDLGYVIPMANGRSCGNVLGFSLKGYLPTALHHVMSSYRSGTLLNKLRVLKPLVRP